MQDSSDAASPESDSEATKLVENAKKRMDIALSSPLTKSFLAGVMSGSISTLLLQPLDLVKTRLQSQVYIGSSQGMISVALTVVRQEHFFGLWKGVWPSLTRCAPGVGLYFSTLHLLRSNFGSESPKALESLVMGMTARSIAAVTILPITVIKTRYESGQYVYKGIANALVSIYKADGIRGLFSGLSATLMRDVPFSGLYLMFYTRLKQLNNPSWFSPTVEPLLDFTNGVIGGALASFVTQPADVIKTNMQLYPKKHQQIKQAIVYIYQERGFHGFWRGIVPRTLRRTLTTALAWTVFEEIMRRCKLKE